MSGSWAAGWAVGDVLTATELTKSMGSVFDTTLGIAAASIDITSIPQGYAHLLLVLYARGDSATASLGAQLRFNGDTGANYDVDQLIFNGTSSSVAESLAATTGGGTVIPGASAAANLFGCGSIVIPHYAGSANNKGWTSEFSFKTGTASGNMTGGKIGGGWRSAAAITRVTVLPSAGNFVAGTRVTLYVMGA